MKNYKLRFIYVLVFLLLFVISSYSNTIKVPQDSTTIQGAINGVSNGDTVLVDDGTYYENISFNGKNIVVASKFILDNDPSHIINTIIDGSNGVRGVNGSCVEFKHGENSTAVIQGFTIQNGSGTLTESWIEGGGIILQGSSATIKNNLIIHNEVPDGGGGISSFRSGGTPHIYNNIIAYNVGNGYAGGLVLNWCGGTVRNNIFYKNIAGGLGSGGIMVWQNESPVFIENNTIIGNSSSSTVGGLSTNRSGTTTVRNNIIWGNTQTSGNEYAFIAATVVENNDICGISNSSGNISIYPEFTNTLFGLDPVSPCLDAGHADVIYNDKDGSRNDMGAYGGPYATIFPDLVDEDIQVLTALIYTMDLKDTLTRQIIISNNGTNKIQIDSMVFPANLNGLQHNPKMNDLLLKPMQLDTIPATIVAKDSVIINDSVSLYLNNTTLTNPQFIPFYYDAVDELIDLDAGLRAYWKMDEEFGPFIRDEADYSHGVNSYASITRTDGLSGKAVCFNKNSSYANINIPHTDSLDFKTDASFSLSLLTKNDPVNYQGEIFLLIKGTTGGLGKWYALSFKSRELRFTVDDNITKTNLPYTLPENYNSSQWHHIVGVRDRKADYMYLYLDGVKVGSTKDNTNASIESGISLLLKNYTQDTNSFLDDVRIYSKALSDSDIVALYSSYDLPALSSNASVTNLAVDGYEFVEGAFNPETKSYTVNIPENISSINISVTTSDLAARVTGAGSFSSIPGEALVIVKSQDFSTSNLYTINVNSVTTVLHETNELLKIYPNPAKENITIEIPENLIGNMLYVHDANGKELLSKRIDQNTSTLDISGFITGLYSIRVKNVQQKIIVD
ncbi:MAG: T9SS type A sorting domain-containing protein [Bacteroidales bacterium]|nr:T9SS type A sorting domain-containing protein [Bacteroidales bacterium]